MSGHATASDERAVRTGDGVAEPNRLRIRTPVAELAFDPSIGNLRELAFAVGERRLAPLHSAPWAEGSDPAQALDEAALPPVERHLAGDFFCAPFGANDVEGGPPHGWTANSAWTCTAASEDRLRATLDKRVMGATIEKRLALASDAPLLYQRHLLSGGSGAISVAHHPMVRMRAGGRLCFSPKRAVLTPSAPLVAGRHRLASGTLTDDPERVPGSDGGSVDLTRLPIGERHEDFVTLVEEPSRTLGWTAVLRDAEDDIVLFLKDPAVLPVTMLWHSNGGRDHAPWNGVHTGVLGVEDGCASEASGHRAALADNRLTRIGVPTALPLAEGRRHRIAHVIGCVPRPRGWTRVVDIAIEGGTLRLTGDAGDALRLPFEAGLFAGGPDTASFEEDA